LEQWRLLSEAVGVQRRVDRPAKDRKLADLAAAVPEMNLLLQELQEPLYKDFQVVMDQVEVVVVAVVQAVWVVQVHRLINLVMVVLV
jgi:hypothetical protein